jgi:hypothetical protein
MELCDVVILLLVLQVSTGFCRFRDFDFVNVTCGCGDVDVTTRKFAGQNHAAIATMTTQNANRSLPVCLLGFTGQLSVQLPERIKATAPGFCGCWKLGHKKLKNCSDFSH